MQAQLLFNILKIVLSFESVVWYFFDTIQWTTLFIILRKSFCKTQICHGVHRENHIKGNFTPDVFIITIFTLWFVFLAQKKSNMFRIHLIKCNFSSDYDSQIVDPMRCYHWNTQLRLYFYPILVCLELHHSYFGFGLKAFLSSSVCKQFSVSCILIIA